MMSCLIKIITIFASKNNHSCTPRWTQHEILTVKLMQILKTTRTISRLWTIKQDYTNNDNDISTLDNETR
uniref:Uncharacterized protein n=1 Tax=Lymantria dispar multicapsid nuclear polyhedrosis virus TaxID=10449 RepID=A0A1B1MQQ4_NPVLD|nr:hypothetical protein [Lymantria dispar multiple nucleopolyhedrovirus]